MKRSAAAVLILGIIVALAGLTFTLQGLGMLGPTGGLMYNNPVWVTQGSVVFIVGLIFIVAGLALNRQRRTTPPT